MLPWTAMSGSHKRAGLGSPVRALLLVVATGLAACGGGGGEFEQVGPGLAIGSLASDWSAPDVNPNSPTFNTFVSPRQRLGKISAWYFAHAT